MDSITHPSRRTLLKSVAATSVAAAFGGLLPLRSAWAQDLPLVSYPPSYQLKTPASMPQLYDLVRIEEQARMVMPAGGFGYVSGGAWRTGTRRSGSDATIRTARPTASMAGGVYETTSRRQSNL